MMNNVLLVASDRLQVRFTRLDDRWGHSIEFFDDSRQRHSLSAHGGSRDNEFNGPVFQYIDNLRTRRDGQQALLLVGKGGSSHWSAAIEADPEKSTITFDVACRFHKEPELLGSRYRVFAISRKFRPKLPHFEVPAIDDGIRRVLEVTDQVVTVRALSHNGPLPRTIRWQYVISLPD
jgi:hypothetical protein